MNYDIYINHFTADLRERRARGEHQRWGEFWGTGPHLRHPPAGHSEGPLGHQTLGHRQGQLQAHPHGEHHKEERDVRPVPLKSLHPR